MDIFQFPKLSFQQAVLDHIYSHMLNCMPNEGCGLLFGSCQANDAGWRIKRFEPGENVSANPRHHFLLDPSLWVRHALSGESGLLGLVHSHPSAKPVPSVQDVMELQQFGGLIQIYVIVSPSLMTKQQNPGLAAYAVYPESNGHLALYEMKWLTLA